MPTAKKDLKEGYIYRVRTRSMGMAAVWTGVSFLGVREKFGAIFLFEEFCYEDGPPFGTVTCHEEIRKCEAPLRVDDKWNKALIKIIEDVHDSLKSRDYVRTQNMLYRWTEDAIGYVMDSNEALWAYGGRVLSNLLDTGPVCIEDYPGKVAETIKQTRVFYNMSVQELAEKTGLAEAVISDIENPKKVNDIHDIAKVCAELNLNVLTIGIATTKGEVT